MTAADRATWLRLVEALQVGGPRSRNVVVGIVGGEEAFERIVEPKLAAGELVWRRARGGRLALRGQRGF